MKKNKEQYCSPTTKTFVVRFEGCLCTSIVKSGSPQFTEQADIEEGESSIFW